MGYFWTPNSMQYTENLTKEIQIHCLDARADIPSGVQKYPSTPKLLNRVNNLVYHQKELPLQVNQ